MSIESSHPDNSHLIFQVVIYFYSAFCSASRILVERRVQKKSHNPDIPEAFHSKGLSIEYGKNIP
jgi:hypothetical protein